MNYNEFLTELKSYSDETYREFHKKLLKNEKINVLGVRTPILRKLAKKYKDNIDELLSFPDEYYDVTFIKLSAVSLLPYERFLEYVNRCVQLIDNWATCDCFAPKCIEKHKDEFLPYIEKFALEYSGEFYQRFALTTLLHFYTDEKYYGKILELVQRVDCGKYYVHMAAAWLVAELVIKFYDKTVEFLQSNIQSDFKYIDKNTHNKAIQKSCESYRLSPDEKTFLKGLKR